MKHPPPRPAKERQTGRTVAQHTELAELLLRDLPPAPARRMAHEVAQLARRRHPNLRSVAAIMQQMTEGGPPA